MRKEAPQPHENIAQVAVLIEDHHRARAHGEPGGTQILEAQAHVEHGGGGKGTRRAPQQYSLQIAPHHAAGEAIDEVTQRDA